MVPHVRKPHKLIDILQYIIVSFVLFAITMMEIFSRIAQIKFETWHHRSQTFLRTNQGFDVFSSNTRSDFSDENVIDIDEKFSIER